MNEGIIKTAEESALDDVTARATELIELWRSFEDSEHFAALKRRGGRRESRLEAHVERLFEARRARGQLPQIGNVERAQVDAATTRIESLLPGMTEEALMMERLGTACSEQLTAIEAARREVDDERTQEILRELRDDSAAFCRDMEVPET